MESSDSLKVFVGTYGNGILTFQLNATEGFLKEVSKADAKSASSIAVHPNGKYLYSTSELSKGAFESWSIASDGSLKKINSVPSQGDSPAHLSIHSSLKYLLGSNYGSGNFLVYPINSDGSIGQNLFDSTPGKASESVPDRQEGPHAHMIVTAPNGNVVGVDLGADKVFSWNLDVESGKMKENKIPYAQVLSGMGCRHIEFHKALGTAYVINELGNTLDAFRYNSKNGVFTAFQQVPTLPEEFKGENTAGEIRIHPNGKFLYGTNRGGDSIVTYRINQQDGRLKLVGWTSSFGSFPRGMALDPSGKFFFIGNQKGNSIIVYSVSEEGAKLEKISNVNNIEAPVDFAFL
eukprot:TRINITY_DN3189_c0_g1_i2.p1 TRINITY_DN3189_c0_g1~~TRINITY_DN3189_c0_g1_i2.p1  ORF type:complete len:348 (+),score=142.88 TRINITY_DN3189_c0_g1_i2:265-1308(+)